MSKHQRGGSDSGQKADTASDDESPEDQPTYWEEVTVVLNYLFQESWYGYVLVGLAVSGLVYWIGSILTIKPIWVGCVSAMIVADFFIFAAFLAYERRSNPKAMPPPPTTQPTTQSAELPAEIRDRLRQLRNSFESLALQSKKGIYHILIERQQIADGPKEPDNGIPLGLSFTPRFPGDPDLIVASVGAPSDPERCRPLSDVETASVPQSPPGDPHDKFFRDIHGHALATVEPAILRDGYFYGDHEIYQPLSHLADAAGKVLRTLPDEILPRLPEGLRSLCRPHRNILRRYAFGTVPAQLRPLTPTGFATRVMLFDGGVVVDHPEDVTGSDHPSANWALFLHRVGWIGDPHSGLLATRHHWIGNVSSDISLGGQFPGMTANSPKPPLTRFYSILGDGKAKSTDVCWASVWAIDWLLATLEKPVLNSSSVAFPIQLAAMRSEFRDASQKYFRCQHAFMTDEAWDKEKASPKLPWSSDVSTEQPGEKSLFVCQPGFSNTVPAMREFRRLSESARHYVGSDTDWIRIVYDTARRNGEVGEYDGIRHLKVDLFTASVHTIDSLLAIS